MAQQNSNGDVRSHRIVKVLSVMGIVLIVLGVLLGIVFPLAVMPAWSTLTAFDDPSRYTIPIQGFWLVTLHIAAGAICLGVAKAIQILEEIRAGA